MKIKLHLEAIQMIALPWFEFIEPTLNEDKFKFNLYNFCDRPDSRLRLIVLKKLASVKTNYFLRNMNKSVPKLKL